MRKNLAFFLAFIICIFLGVPSFAAEMRSGTCGKNAVWTLDEDGVFTVSGTGSMTDYRFFKNPPPWNGNISIKKIIIEDGITEIGNYAFDYCINLMDVSIPDSLTRIGDNAFSCCKSLKEINIPDSVTSIGSQAFYQCDSLTDIILPGNVDEVGTGVFADCANLTDVTISNGLTYLSEEMFQNCPHLQTVVLPPSVTNIRRQAFAGCTGLKRVDFLTGVARIGDSTFSDCTGLTEVIISRHVEELGKSLFSACDNLLSVTVDANNQNYASVDGVLFDKENKTLLQYPAGRGGFYSVPAGVTTIKAGAFSGNLKLTGVSLPDGLKRIEEWAFADCGSLENIRIPSSLSYIGSHIFEASHNLRDLYYAGTERQWGSIILEYVEQANEIVGVYKELPIREYMKAHGDPFPGVTRHYDSDAIPAEEIRMWTIDFNQEGLSDWARTEVVAAVNLGLVPENLRQNYTGSVTRGDVVQMFINLLEDVRMMPVDGILSEKNVTVNSCAFIDTEDQAVLSANALGIIQGVGNNKFDSEGTLTRSQIAAIINRVAEVLEVPTGGYSHDFTDVDGHWVNEELGWPVHTGIIQGVGDHKFAPDDPLTTEQAIAIAYRALRELASWRLNAWQ